MLKFAIVIAILLGGALSQCTTGCLKCSSTTTCLFCDFTSGYFLNATYCNSTTKTGCKLVDINGNCLTCSSTASYVDPTTKNCLALAANATISNCQLHSGPSVCLLCNSGFFMVNATTCNATAAISNCLAQDTNITCSACNSGFALSPTKQACLALSQSGCRLYSAIQCNSCKSGFNFNPNLFLGSILTNSFNPTFFFSFLQQQLSSQFTSQSLPVCYQIANCLTYFANFTCQRCQNGFYYNIANAACVSNPLPRVIPFCQTYLTATTCAQCMPGFIAPNNVTCVLNGVIPGCIQYDFTSPFTKCLTCSNTTFMNSPGLCSNRTNININNCLNYSIFTDTCSVCANGTMLTTDSRACLNLIANCGAYAASSVNTVTLTCTACNSGYFYNSPNNQCIGGSVLQCNTYSTSANTCTSCLPGFYLNNNLCPAVTAIAGCATPSNTAVRQCNQCSPNWAKFTTNNFCTPITLVTNCLTYSSATTCSVCRDGFSLSSNTCTAVSFPGCAVFTGAACSSCTSNLVFSTGNTACQSPPAIDSAQCASGFFWGTDQTSNPVACKFCGVFSAPVNYKNAAFCSSVASSASGFDANCAFYTATVSGTTTTYQCTRCTGTNMISGSTCVASCPANNIPYTYFIQTNFATAGKYSITSTIQQNACGSNASPLPTSCALASPLFIQSSTTPAYGCAQCASTFFPMVTLSSPSVLRASITSSSANPTLTAITPQSKIPAVSSCLATGSSILGSGFTSGPTSSCAYYYSIPNLSQNACLQCAWGFTGVVLNYIAYCFSYSGTANGSTCTQCQIGYYIGPNALSCIRITPVDTNCQFYDNTASVITCIQCNVPVAWRSIATGPPAVGTCMVRTTKAQCATYNALSDNCMICNTGWVMLGGNCYANIPNCFLHGLNTGGNAATCTNCDPTSTYPTVNSGITSCTTGTVTNCNLYLQSITIANYCVGCSGTNTLSNGSCFVSQASNTNGLCASQTAPATCNSCYFSALRFTTSNMCKTPTSISNCATYSSATTCSACASGFYLSSLTSCTANPTGNNCARFGPLDLNGDGLLTAADIVTSTSQFVATCLTCANNFYIVNATSVNYVTSAGTFPATLATCQATTFGSIPNCASNGMNSDGTGNINNVDCKSGCATGFTPFAWDGLKMCVVNTYLTASNQISDANCLFYNYVAASTNKYVCAQCKYGWALSGNACVQTCAAGSYIALYTLTQSGTTNNYQITSRNVCLAPPSSHTGNYAIDSNCLYLAPQFNPPTSTWYYICVQCKSTFLPIVDLDPISSTVYTFTLLFSNFDPSLPTSSTLSITSPFALFPEILACPSLASLTIYPATAAGQLLANCQYYSYISAKTATDVGCIRCNDGFTGPIALKTTTSPRGYINACTADTSCDITNTAPYKVFQNDANFLLTWGSIRALFSCFKCTAAGALPVAFRYLATASPFNSLGWRPYIAPTGTDPTSPTLYNIFDAAFTADQNTVSLKNIQCLTSATLTYTAPVTGPPAVPASGYFDTTQVTYAFSILNCALLVANTNLPYNAAYASPVTMANDALFCVACKPGYTPTYTKDGSSTFTYVSACTIITNCVTATPGFALNACETCAFGRMVVNTFQAADYSKCIAPAISNCFYATSTTVCNLCVPGYTLSVDSTSCTLLADSNSCTIYQLADPFYTAVSGVSGFIPSNWDAMLGYFSMTYWGGCATCATGRTLVTLVKNLDNLISTEFCVTTTPKPFINTSAAPYTVTNCATYGWLQSPTGAASTSIVCLACTSGNTINNSSPPGCTTNTGNANTANCILYNASTSKCVTCTSTSFLNVNGLCTSVTTLSASSNCASFNFVASLTSTTGAVCLQCAQNYYLQNSNLNCCIFGSYWLTNTCATISSISGMIANCGVVAGSPLACTQCMPGYVLVTQSSTLSCFRVFAGTIAIGSGTDHDAGCSVLASGPFNNFQLSCSICTTTSTFPMTPISTDPQQWCYSMGITNNPLCQSFYTTQPSTYSALTPTCNTCASVNSNFLNGSNVCTARTSTVTNCAYYTPGADTCSYCTAGNSIGSNTCTAIVAPTNPTLPTAPAMTPQFYLTNTGGYYDTCATAITNCNTAVFYNGLDAPLSTLYSCHVCTGSAIPFVFVNGGNTTYSGIQSLFMYSLNNTANSRPGLYFGDVGIKCLAPTASSFYTSGGAVTFTMNFPANCALGAVNVNSLPNAASSNAATNVNRDNIFAFCTACAPMYKAAAGTDTSGNTVTNFVSSCTAISNCQSSITVNACDVCAPNTAFVYTAANDIDFTACVSFTVTANCMVVTLIGSANVCMICKLGYYVNIDGACEAFTSPLCNTNAGLNPGNAQFEKNMNGINFISALIWQPYRGCTSCSGGLMPVQGWVDRFICQASTYLNPNPPATSLFTANCQNYINPIVGSSAANLGSTVLCGVCKAGFIITTVSTCVTQLDMNCLIAINSNSCSVCNPNYNIVNGVCAFQNILNCVSYSTVITTSLVCTACASTYTVVNNTCIVGPIPNCQTYSSPTACSACFPSYVLRTNNTGQLDCVPMDPTLNCAAFSSSVYNTYQIQCTTCQQNFFLTSYSSTTKYDQCVQVPLVANCTAYDIEPTILTSSYVCVQCNNSITYLASNRTCIARTNASLANCNLVNPTSDTCLVPTPPSPGVVAVNTVSIIQPQPSGINNCIYYSSSLNCLQCNTNMYFNGTDCLNVPTSSLISNCQYYFQNLTCMTCNTNYFLQNNLCFPILGSNCQTVDPGTFGCLTCPIGYGLFFINGLNTCTLLNIANCVKYNTIAPYNCITCKSGYGLNNSTCALLNTTVTNCALHQADGLCQVCSSGFAHFLNQTTVTTTNATTNLTTTTPTNISTCNAVSGFSAFFSDPNCDSFTYNPNGICVACASGYFNQQNTCVSCNANGNNAGCLVCDYSNPSTCLMCQPGYYQASTGSCISLTPIIVLNNTTNLTTGISARIFGFLYSLTLLILAIRF